MPTPLPESLQNWLDAFNGAKQLLLEKGFIATPSNAREALELITRRFVETAPEIPLVKDALVPGAGHQVPVRIYHPAPGEALPLLIFAHGGGHMAGSLSLYDRIARRLTEASGHLLVSVDYRLAPECRYPAGLQDLVQVVEGIRPLLRQLQITAGDGLSLAGDSAGGALCASAAHHFQYRPDHPIDKLVLIYPSLDYTLSHPSTETLASGYLLERERILWYFDNYFPPLQDRRLASPLFMPADGRLPQTLLLTAEYCPLRDEGAAYVERLRTVGVQAELLPFDGMVHAFLNLESLVPDSCARAYREIGRFLQKGRRV
ncbi:MAG: alpha/beta hydrolase [Gammaproteobacteria bacterium]|nr:alpha/beta hydrolase [Gammaproteobacteria bacterium]